MITTNPVSRRTTKRIAYMILLSIGPFPCRAQDEMFDSLLQEVVVTVCNSRLGCILIGPDLGRYPPGPRFTPVKGLDSKAAVPFLIRVLLEGPDWKNEKMLADRGGIYPHIARCYAALCLGAIGDPNAFGPLIEILQRGDYLEHKYTITSSEKLDHDIREYAAIALGLLGDQRAVDPLLEQLPKSRNVNIAFSLARLGDVRAIAPLIEYGFRLDPDAHGQIHRCLEVLTKTRVKLEYDLDERRVTDPIFPELGRMDKTEVYRCRWRYWLAGNGRRYAKEQFDKYYADWKPSLMESPQALDVHASLKRKMLAGGIVIMPELIDKLETDGEDLLAAIEYLSGELIPKSGGHLTRAEVLNWWNRNKQKWFDQNWVGP